MSDYRVHFRLIIAGIGLTAGGARVAAFEPPTTPDVADSGIVDRLFEVSPGDQFSLGLLQDEVVEPERDREGSNFRRPSVFRLRPLYWAPELDGSMSLDNIFDVNTSLDFGRDLGVDDPDPVLAGEIGVHLGPTQLRLSGFNVESDAVVTADQSIIFGDVSISAGDLVESDIDIQNYKVLLGLSLLNPTDHGIGLAISGGIDWYQIEARVEDVTSTFFDEIDEDVPIPVMGLHLEVPLDTLQISLDVSGFSIEVEDIDVDYLDLSASLAWMPVSGVAVVGGYRMIDANLTTDDLHFDATLDGPFFGVEIRF